MKDTFNRDEILARTDLCLADAACHAVFKLKPRALRDDTFWILHEQRARHKDRIEFGGGYPTADDAFRGETICLRDMLKPFRLRVEPVAVDLDALTNKSPDGVLVLITSGDFGILHASCYEKTMYDGAIQLSDREIPPEELRVGLMYAKNRMGGKMNGLIITRR